MSDAHWGAQADFLVRLQRFRPLIVCLADPVTSQRCVQCIIWREVLANSSDEPCSLDGFLRRVPKLAVEVLRSLELPAILRPPVKQTHQLG